METGWFSGYRLTEIMGYDMERPLNGLTQRFGAIIIGAGQAARPLAYELGKRSIKTAVVEKDFVGGSCINYGCTPTKTMLASAHAADLARRLPGYGVYAGDEVAVAMPQVLKRKNRVVGQFRHSQEEQFAHYECLELIYGEAAFQDKQTVEVRLRTGGRRSLQSELIFINCGTRAAVPPVAGLAELDYLTSRTLLDLAEIPEHLLILGGGYIGLEFGQMFRRFGSAVTILQRGGQLLSREDPEVALEMERILRQDGIAVHTHTQAQRVTRLTGGTLQITAEANGTTCRFTGSHLLVAAGTQPNTDALNLPAAGVVVDEGGFIRVNDQLQTSQPGIYALGDIKGGPAFTHISYDDYRIIRTNLLDGGSASTRDRMVPYTVFTDPQLGRVGLTETEARRQGYRVKTARLPMRSVARAIELDQTRGLIQAVVDMDTDKLLGAAVLGMEGGEIMAMLQIAMMGNLSYQALRDSTFAHPTLAEALNSLFAGF